MKTYVSYVIQDEKGHKHESEILTSTVLGNNTNSGCCGSTNTKTSNNSCCDSPNSDGSACC